MLKITISDRKKYFPKMCLSASGPLRALVGLRKRPLETCNVDCAPPGDVRCGGRLHTRPVCRVAVVSNLLKSWKIMKNDENHPKR